VHIVPSASTVCGSPRDGIRHECLSSVQEDDTEPAHQSAALSTNATSAADDIDMDDGTATEAGDMMVRSGGSTGEACICSLFAGACAAVGEAVSYICGVSCAGLHPKQNLCFAHVLAMTHTHSTLA